MGIKENILKLRQQYDLTQKELGDIAGVSDKAVSSWESGEREPRMGALQKIADHFSIKKSDIIEDDGFIATGKSSGYYTNPETVKAAQDAYDQNGVLFDAAKDLKPESIKEVLKFIEFQKAKENHENED